MENELEFYYWPTPNGWKISIALEELNLTYKVNLINIHNGDQFKKKYKNVLLNGKIPAITYFDKNQKKKKTIFESGNILIFLAKKTKKLYGSNYQEEMNVNQWIFWQVANLGPMAGQAHHFLKYAPNFLEPVVIPYAQKRYKSEVTKLYNVLEKNLTEKNYVAGNFFSIADISILPWIAQWKDQRQDLDNFENVKKWFFECCKRPSVKKGFELYKELRYQKINKEKSEKIFFNN